MPSSFYEASKGTRSSDPAPRTDSACITVPAPFSLRFQGVGSALPPTVLTNTDLSKTMDTSHEWIYTRTGICQRHVSQEGETMSQLAVRAAQRALEHGECTLESIDLILLATSTPDHAFPPSAMRVLQTLGANNAIAFDVNVACSGFLYALTIAQGWLIQKALNRYSCKEMPKSHPLARAVVIGAETLSRLLDWNDRSTAVLFGDGAGAVVLDLWYQEPEEKSLCASGLLGSHLLSLPKGYDQLYVSSGPGSSCARGVICMEGREVFRQAVCHMEASSRTLLAHHNLSISDIDWVVSHQANKRILMAVAERLAINSEKVVYTGHQHANTAAASIPLALEVAWKQQKHIQPGHLVLFQAFGAGFTCASALVRF